MIKLFSVKVNFDRLYFFFWAKQHPDRCSIIDMRSALLGGIMLFQKMVFFPAGVINGESCEESTTLITLHANKGVLCSILLVGISRYICIQAQPGVSKGILSSSCNENFFL